MLKVYDKLLIFYYSKVWTYILEYFLSLPPPPTHTHTHRASLTVTCGEKNTFNNNKNVCIFLYRLHFQGNIKSCGFSETQAYEFLNI